jgi:dimeric dUTPase (all-alpha-NTP-PPase superfamily)
MDIAHQGKRPNIPRFFFTFGPGFSAKKSPASPCKRYEGFMAQVDKLDEIFRMQEILNKKIGVDLANLSPEDKTKWALNYSRAMTQEIAELIDSFPWKWWAKYQKIDEQNARVEVVDLFHFLVSLAQTLGMTAQDIYDGYVKKNEVNHKRQESGYAVKDHADSRHI